jgi:hypothetical protein
VRTGIVFAVTAALACFGLLDTSGSFAVALAPAVGLSASVAALALIPAWRFARADITRRRTT